MLEHPLSKLFTYLEISHDAPHRSQPTHDSQAVVDNILCKVDHQSYFRSILSKPEVSLPWCPRHCLLSTSLKQVSLNQDYLHLHQNKISPFFLPNTNTANTANTHLPFLPTSSIPPDQDAFSCVSPPRKCRWRMLPSKTSRK